MIELKYPGNELPVEATCDTCGFTISFKVDRIDKWEHVNAVKKLRDAYNEGCNHLC